MSSEAYEPFVNDEDVRKIENYGDFLATGVTFTQGYHTFMEQLYTYLKDNGCEESIIKPLKEHNIEKFNENIKFPSHRSYMFMDNYFTGAPDSNLYRTLDRTSRNFLGYFYEIWLHEEELMFPEEAQTCTS